MLAMLQRLRADDSSPGFRQQPEPCPYRQLGSVLNGFAISDATLARQHVQYAAAPFATRVVELRALSSSVRIGSSRAPPSHLA